MIDINALWIGDKVSIVNNGQSGTFEGVAKDGKPMIKINGSIQIFSVELLQEYKEINEEIDLKFLQENRSDKQKAVVVKKASRYEIDLHIEKLSPEYKNSQPSTILDIQLEATQKFIHDAIQNQLKTVTIIHGKGEGKLKELVHQYIETLPQTKWKILKNRDGATEVWFEYIKLK